MTNIIEFRSNRMARRARKKRGPAKPRSVVASEERVIDAMRDPASWGVDPQTVRLAANEEVTAEFDAAGRIRRAMRYDVFALLFYRPNSRMSPSSYDAVRRLQADLAILHRTQGACDAIRGTSPGFRGALAEITASFARARIEAGERVEHALHGDPERHVGGVRPWVGRLLRELCETEVTRGQTANWHAIVRRHTGEINRMRRAEHVRTCCDELAASYRALDNEPRRAAG